VNTATRSRHGLLQADQDQAADDQTGGDDTYEPQGFLKHHHGNDGPEEYAGFP
jgi:hypothetical protein